MPPQSIGGKSSSIGVAPKSPKMETGIRRHVAKLVYSELFEANSPLSEEQLVERTLLPEPAVEEAIAALEAKGLFTARRRNHEGHPTRYVVSGSR